MARQPNVVFVLTDDQGYGEMGCHGNPVIQTPNMDALHAESVRLTNYHVGPTCAPTRAGLLTGHFHNSTGVWHTIGGRSLLRKDEYSLATAFGEHGYVTGLFGKWHLGDNYPYRPQDRGFQEVVTHGGGGVGNTPDYWGNKYNDDHYCVNGDWQPFQGYCTDVWFDQALGFIERHRDEPFLCFVTTNAPHSPFVVDESYSAPYVGQVATTERAEFYGMITCIDENLGVLRQKLAEWGLTQDTILIFGTDNGTAGGATPGAGQFIVDGYNASMRGIKGSEYEGGHRVPLFIHWPGGGLDQGRDVDTLTANVDVMPTLLEWCGIDAGEHRFHGQSVAPLLRGEGEDWPERILVTDSQRLTSPVKWLKSATMSQRWRLINGVELYDMAADPGQRHDVAGAHPEVVGWLRGGYEAWWDTVSTQFDGTIPITLGEWVGIPALLNSHDWRNDPVECAWNQSLVRAGVLWNGYWEVDVAQEGRYRFELRRWPRAEDRPIGAGMPGEVVEYYALRTDYGGGVALPITRARLQVGHKAWTQHVAELDVAAVFEVLLHAGETRVQTWFEMDDGRSLGAYFVYVERR